jgi:hypothetical protein
LTGNDRGKHIETQTDGKHVEKAAGTMIKIASGIQKFMGGEIHRQHGDRISLLFFSKQRK